MSLIDLGWIKWNNDVNNYQSSEQFSLTGIDLNRYLNNDTLDFKDYIDLIFLPKTKVGSKIKTAT